MAKYAVIEEDKVVNIIEAENAEALPSLHLVLLEDGYGIGDSYIDGVFVDTSQKDSLLAERADLMSKLNDLDYIGVKIATGRATPDEYTDQIALMNQYAARINEIDAELQQLASK